MTFTFQAWNSTKAKAPAWTGEVAADSLALALANLQASYALMLDQAQRIEVAPKRRRRAASEKAEAGS